MILGVKDYQSMFRKIRLESGQCGKTALLIGLYYVVSVVGLLVFNTVEWRMLMIVSRCLMFSFPDWQ